MVISEKRMNNISEEEEEDYPDDIWIERVRNRKPRYRRYKFRKSSRRPSLKTIPEEVEGENDGVETIHLRPARKEKTRMRFGRAVKIAWERRERLPPTREVKEAWSSTECISAEETEEIEETQEKTTIIDISEENIKEENIREVNIKEENIKEDTIKEDNIKEENIKEDNIKEDNIKEDNIREDNIREDNIKEDNIRPPTREVKEAWLSTESIRNKCKWWIPKCLRRRSRSSVRNISKKDSKETESRPQKLFRLFSCCISKSVTE
ncbi:uncharacterized protein ACNLHF_023008 [Anomaloglossus baeobatrachus]